MDIKSQNITDSGKEVFDAMLALGATAPKVFNESNVDGFTPFAVVPNGASARDLAAFFPKQRIQQRVTLLEAGSFADYVNRYKTNDTLIFANVTESTACLTAVLDYHTSAPELTPRYLSHLAVFSTLETPEWKTWKAANRKTMTQVEFATWLEDNAKLFTDPQGADLLEIVQTLFGKQDVRFTSAVRLQSGGNKLHYDEDVELSGSSTTRGGTVELPKEITALLPVFQGSAAYVVRARLKYKIESRKLVIWFETIAVHEIVRHAIMAVVAEIAEKTAINPLLGSV